MHRNLGIVRLLAIVALVVGACSSSATPAPTIGPTAVPTAPPAATAAAPTPVTSVAAGTLLVYAASSLTTAFNDLGMAYTAATGQKIVFSYGSSSTLRTQIEQGAPADLFVSADTTNPATLVKENLATGTPVNFAGNTLAIIVPAANTANIQTPADIARSGIKFVAAGSPVPIEKYATMLIANLAKQPGYPAGFVASVTANTVSQETDDKSIVAKIELGEGDAAIVYVTDSNGNTKVKSIAIPTGANVSVTYAAVGVAASRNQSAGQAFLAWLVTAPAQAILAKYGFLPPS